jgi:transcriptional regulator with XRE-family HTH domain
MKLQQDLDRCGKNLSQLREKQRMTISALSALSGVAEDVIIRFEQGKGGDTSINELLKVAEVLDVELSAILTKT